jgi:fumarate reductase subunit D
LFGNRCSRPLEKYHDGFAMIHTLRQRLKTASAAVSRRLSGLIREMAPPVLFFFIALMMLFLLFKLFVAQYEIEFYAFGKAAVGALILGKAVLLMQWAESGRRFSSYPRAVVVAGKTLVYGLAVIVLGAGERIIHAVREAGNLQDAVETLIANADLHRFLGFVLLISLIVAVYLTIQEIDRAMGKGALFRLFFQRPSSTVWPEQKETVN